MVEIAWSFFWQCNTLLVHSGCDGQGLSALSDVRQLLQIGKLNRTVLFTGANSMDDPKQPSQTACQTNTQPIVKQCQCSNSVRTSVQTTNSMTQTLNSICNTDVKALPRMRMQQLQLNSPEACANHGPIIQHLPSTLADTCAAAICTTAAAAAVAIIV